MSYSFGVSANVEIEILSVLKIELVVEKPFKLNTN